MRRYKALDCKGQKGLYSAFLKYGFDSFVVEILYFNVPYLLMDATEIFAIANYQSYGPKGYNGTEGGDFLPDNKGRKHTKRRAVSLEERTKRSENILRRKQDVDWLHYFI